MDEQRQFLEQVCQLPPRERAAAIAHWVYTITAQGMPNWDTRVPERWERLPPEAREFNLAAIDTWSRSEELLGAWLDAVAENRRRD